MSTKARKLLCSLAFLAVLIVTSAAQTPPAPPGYECVDNFNCYKLYTTKKTFGDAWDLCRNDGGQLGIINSDEEAFIYSGIFSREAKEKQMFVGIHDLIHEGTWMTIGCETLASTGYTKWDAGEPNNKRKHENCGAMLQGGLLNDVDCTGKLMFICEI